MKKTILTLLASLCLLIQSPLLASPRSQSTTLSSPLAIHSPPRVALVLGAGGARGYAQVGVIDILRQAGVPIDLIVGTSVGSIVGALYAAHPNACLLSQDMLRAGYHDFIDVGLPFFKAPVTGKNLRKFISNKTQVTDFSQLKIPFVAVATNLATGKAAVFSTGPLAPAVNASAAISPVVRPVMLDGMILVDGGMVDPVPTDVAKRYRPQLIIAVNIARTPSQKLPHTAIGAFMRSQTILLGTLSELGAANADVAIHPAVGNAGTFNLSDKYLLLRAGEIAAKQALPRILALMKAHHIALTPPERDLSHCSAN